MEAEKAERLPIAGYLWLPGAQLMVTQDAHGLSFQQPWGLHALDPNPPDPEPERQVALIPFPMPEMEGRPQRPGQYL